MQAEADAPAAPEPLSRHSDGLQRQSWVCGVVGKVAGGRSTFVRQCMTNGTWHRPAWETSGVLPT